ncbi:MAG: hypothetical protein ACFB03_23775 [Paracoccaceae bacterium]
MKTDPELLPPEAPDPEAHDVTPGMISRNRVWIERARHIGRAAIPFTPPPVRLGLACATVAADVVLLADDLRRRRVEDGKAHMEAGALAMEAVAIAAMSRFAPARLAANLAGIEAVRQAFKKAAT